MSRFLFVVMWIVAIFVGGPSRPAQAGDGLLLIDVGMVRLNEFGQFAAWEPVSSYTLRNLNTRRVYEFRYFLSGVRVSAEEIEEGDYCIDSVYAYLSRTVLYFCDEPFFRVVAGRVNNGGRWQFALSDGPPTRKLRFGPQEFDAVMAEARKFDKAALRKYGLDVD
jgi:hypothetical protein